MYSFFIKSITIFIFSINILTGCSTGSNGEFIVGNPGSPVWFGMASQETVIDYYKKSCKAYGYTEGSTDMASCIQNSINSGKDRAEKRKMNSFKILDDMDRRERESYQPPSSGTVTCSQQGYFTKCNY
jgi:hypothetical protein